jgi:hypothetical protein
LLLSRGQQVVFRYGILLKILQQNRHAAIWRLEKGKTIGKYLAEMTEKSTRAEGSLRDLATASPGLVICGI